MSWVRIDVDMPHHPKLVKAGLDAFVLDVASICYSNRYGTDGFIADAILHSVSPLVHDPSTAAARLVAEARWVRDDARGGFHIHDYDQYQPPATVVAQRTERRRAAGQLGGLTRWHGKEEATAIANAKQMPSKLPSKAEANSLANSKQIRTTKRSYINKNSATTATEASTRPVDNPVCSNVECSSGWVLDDNGDAIPCHVCGRQR